MERNQRVVKSLLEENLNRYFSGQRGLSRGNVVETSTVQSRDSDIVRHNQDNKYGRSVPSLEYKKLYGRTPRENCEQQPVYYQRDDIQFGSSTERYGKRDDDTIYGNRNVGAIGYSYGSKSNDDRRANSSHCESKSSSKSYGFSRNDNNLRNSDCYSNDANSGNRDSCIGYYDKSQGRNSDALGAGRFSNYNVDSNNGDHYDINCGPRNYVRNNIDRFSSNNICHDSAANTNRFNNNAVGSIGSKNEDCFERNSHPARNDLSNEFMNNGCFTSDQSLGNNRFIESRNNDHPESNSYSGNNFFGANKQMYTNVREMTTPTFTEVDRKRPYEFKERGDYSKSARIDNASATLPPTLVPSAIGAAESGDISSVKSGKSRNRSSSSKARTVYRKACGTVRQYLGCDLTSLTADKLQILRNCRSRIRMYEHSYPEASFLSEGLNCSTSIDGESNVPAAGIMEREPPAARAQGSKVSKTPSNR